MAKLTRTSKYSDLRQGLDNEKQAYFDHLKKLEEQKRLQEIQRQKQLQEQNKQIEIEKQKKTEDIKQEEVEGLVKEENVIEEPQEVINKDIKRKPILSYLLIVLFTVIMITSTIMWKKGLDSNTFTRVNNDNLALYKYYENVDGYLNISKLDNKFIEDNEYNEKNFASSYIEIVNKSEETQKYNVVIKIDDPNGVASNYEYCILLDASIENKELEDKDFYFIQTISNYGGNLLDLTNGSNLSNTLLIQNGILNKNDSKFLNIYIHKIDESISDNIDIDILVIN